MARAGLAAIVVEGMDGDAEAGGVGGAGLAAGGEVLGQNEELLTGAAGAFHPYTSAHGGGRGKAGVSRSHTLDRWLRTAVVKMGWKGRAHSEEQMTYLYPTTMLAYKAGLPKDVTRLRGVHTFVYSVLLTEKRGEKRQLDEIFRAAIGKGLIFHTDKDYDCQSLVSELGQNLDDRH